MRKFPVLLLFSCLLCGHDTVAEDEGWVVGGGLLLAPSLYKDQSDTRIPLPYVAQGLDYFVTDNDLFLSEDTAGYRFFKDQRWEFSLLGKLQTWGYDESDGAAFSGLADKQNSFDLGLGLAYTRANWRVDLRGYSDVLGYSDGQEYQLRLSRIYNGLSSQVFPSIGLTYYSSSLLDYYFSSSVASEIESRPFYRASSGVSVGVGLRWSYRFSPRWAFEGFANFQSLPNAIKESPLVDASYETISFWGFSYKLGTKRKSS